MAVVEHRQKKVVRFEPSTKLKYVSLVPTRIAAQFQFQLFGSSRPWKDQTRISNTAHAPGPPSADRQTKMPPIFKWNHSRDSFVSPKIDGNEM